jgi:hypothetical protein
MQTTVIDFGLIKFNELKLNDSRWCIFTGETIDVEVEITAHHMGYFDFKVCPNEDFSLDKGQDCFDK